MGAQGPALQLSLWATVTLRYAKPWSSLQSHHLGDAAAHQTPASEPSALLPYPQAAPPARGAHARHTEAAAGMGAQTSLLMEPGCRSSSSPAGSTGCGERAAVAQCILQPSKGHKHRQTPAQRWWGCLSTAVVPPGHPCPTQGELAGSPLLEGHRGAKQARGSLPALALLVLGERHLHIGCLPVWLYLQELKEEQRLLPGQRQEGAGRAPTALPRHPSLSSRADACLTCSSGPPAVETPPPHTGSTGQARPPRWLGRLCQCRPVSLGL